MNNRMHLVDDCVCENNHGAVLSQSAKFHNFPVLWAAIDIPYKMTAARRPLWLPFDWLTCHPITCQMSPYRPKLRYSETKGSEMKITLHI